MSRLHARIPRAQLEAEQAKLRLHLDAESAVAPTGGVSLTSSRRTVALVRLRTSMRNTTVPPVGA